MLQWWNVCSIDGLRVVCYQAGTSFVCTIACVHDRGRAVPVAVVHGRAWPSCLWPWCRGRDHGRAVSAVAVRHVVAVAVITAALGVRRAWPWCRGFCVAVVWLRHADGC